MSGEAGVGKTVAAARVLRPGGAAPHVSCGAPATPCSRPGPLGPLFDLAEATGGSSRSSSSGVRGRTRSPRRWCARWPAGGRRCSCSRISTGPTRRRSTCCGSWRGRSRPSPRSCSRATATRARSRSSARPWSSGSSPRLAPSTGLRSRRFPRTPSAELAEPYGDRRRRTCTGRRAATRSSSPRCSRPARGEIPRTVRDAVLARVDAALASPLEGCLRRSRSRRRRPRSGCSRRSPRRSLIDLEECLASGMVSSERGGRGASATSSLGSLSRSAIPPDRRVSLHRDAAAALAAPPERRTRPRPHRASRRRGRRRGRPCCGSRRRRRRAPPRSAPIAKPPRSTRVRSASRRSCRPSEQAELLERRAFECYLTGEFDGAIAAQERALAHRRALDDRLAEGDCLRSLSRLYRFLGRTEEAAEIGRRGDRSAGGASRRAASWRWPTSTSATCYTVAEDADQAITWSAKAIELGERLGDAQVRELCAHQHRRRPDLHRRSGGAGHGSSRASSSRCVPGSRRTPVAPTSTSSGGRSRRRRYDLVDRYLESRASSTAPSTAWTCGASSSFRAARAWSSTGAVGPSAAESAELALRDRRTWPVPRVFALTVLGLVRARRGEPDAWPLLDEALAAGGAHRRAAADLAVGGREGRGRVARGAAGCRSTGRPDAALELAVRRRAHVGDRRARLLAPPCRRSRRTSAQPVAGALCGRARRRPCTRRAALWAELGLPIRRRARPAPAPTTRRPCAGRSTSLQRLGARARGDDRRAAPARAGGARAAARPEAARRGRTRRG